MPRFLCAVFVLLGFAFVPLARAHGPFEGSLKIEATAESLEVTAVLSLDAARLLLPADKRESFQAETFSGHRAALRAAAAAVCTLLDSAGAVVPSDRVLVALNRDGEVHFLILYPAATRPARLNIPFLEAQSAGCFCAFTDATVPAPRHATLLKGNAFYVFPSAPSS